MPHLDPARALEVSTTALTEAPIWPQLPNRALTEHMEIQYSEGMPRRVIESSKERMFFDTSGDYSEELAVFYDHYLRAMDPDEGTGDCSALAISPEYAAGLHAFLDRLEGGSMRPPFLKVHTTGPVSFALTVVDEAKRALYYNEEFRDMVVKALAMKCRWQIQRFQRFCEQAVICFIDEPILAAFGSSTYVSVSRGEVVAMLKEVVDAIHADGALAGVHCCANTEWSIPIDAGIDILNFDAFGYGETITLYAEHVKRYIDRGGSLAWGIVPTSDSVRGQTAEGLSGRLASLIEGLASATGLPESTIREQTLITGSCGTGSLSEEDAESVFSLTSRVSRRLREEHGLPSADCSAVSLKTPLER
jgi:hypothetical protein